MTIRILGDGTPKPAGTWDWWGNYDPAHRGFVSYGMQTFSIGVFRWQAKGSRKGTKKGKTVKRFVAPSHTPDEAYTRARAFIAEQEAPHAE